MKKMNAVIRRTLIFMVVLSVFAGSGMRISASSVIASGQCGKSLTWTLSDDYVLTISGSGDMTDYQNPHDSTDVAPWYEKRSSVKTLVVENTVNSIGDYAFSGCTNLMRTTVPESVTDIGEGAFELCESMQSFTLSESIHVLHKGVFSGCRNLENVNLPSGLAAIEDYAFSVCENLKYVLIPANVALIGDYAFSDCYSLQLVSIPDSVVSIGKYAFFKCRSLQQIVIPHNVQTLGDYSFFDCPALQEISIGEGLSDVGRCAFYGCDALETIYYEGTEEDWDNINIHSYGNDDLINADIVCDQEITVEPDSIALASSSVVEVGDRVSIGVLYLPANTTEKQITWSCGNTSVASVDESGIVRGLKVGTAAITAASSNGKTASVSLHVVFSDVPYTGMYYSTPVYWAVEKGITNGFTDEDGLARTFGPQQNCTRAQMVTFLWRLAGKPSPKSMTSSFSDVKDTSKYYYKAVLWAAEKGITSGYSDGTFKPDNTCLREHAVTFLWRYAGKPSVTTKNTFTDVSSSDYYYKAVLWAAHRNITKGYADDNYQTFRPKLDCLREHIVTFMYRYAK